MIKEAIVLAGGLGTRLKNVIKDIPKPMADINGKPFLEYLFNYLEKYKINRVILSVGFKHEAIDSYFGKKYKDIDIIYAVEEEPLGTGGGILNAISYPHENLVYLLNGDTFFNVDLFELYHFHSKSKADFSLSLKRMHNFDRYGTVEMNADRIIKFNEKKYKEEGLINGGVYILNRFIYDSLPFPHKFSFETDFLEKYLNHYFINGYITDEYFIDIGIPEDYERAQKELNTIK